MLYLLDTNTVSHLIKSHPLATQRLLAVPMHTVCVSAITAGELAFGLAKRPQAVALKAAVDCVNAAVECALINEYYNESRNIAEMHRFIKSVNERSPNRRRRL